eukprot:s6023_g5.t1
MRARITEHLRKHSETYEKEHDGKGPCGATMTFEEYLDAISQEGSYGSQIEDMRSRYAAGLFDFEVSAGCFVTVLVVALYGFASSDSEAQAGAREIMEAAVAAGHPYLLAGDWNAVQTEGHISDALLNGVLCACDSVARGEPLPNTGPKYAAGALTTPWAASTSRRPRSPTWSARIASWTWLSDQAEVRRRVPDLPFLGDFGESTRNQVGKLLEHYQTEEKDRATEHYKSLIQHDEAKLRTFVKNRADMQLDWEKEPPPPDQVDEVLAEIPRPEHLGELHFSFTAQKIRAATARMRGKAGGADDWKPGQLPLLPEAWWVLAAALWEKIFECRQVPMRTFTFLWACYAFQRCLHQQVGGKDSFASDFRLVRSLVVPCYSWAAPFAVPSDGDLKDIRNAVAASFHRHFKCDAARALVYEHSGWDCEPYFATDTAVLRHLWRILTIPPLWLDTLPLAQAFPDWTEALPRLGPLLARLGWWLERDGPRLCWQGDDGTTRAFRVGFDSFKEVKALLRQHHRDKHVHTAGRERIAVGAPERPKAPLAIDFEDLLHQLFDTLAGLKKHPVIYPATDGSSRQGFGAFAVVTNPGLAHFATGNDEEDQESYKQELLALRMAAMGLHHLVFSLQWRGLCIVASDCQAALHAVGGHTEDHVCELPVLAEEVRELFVQVQRVGPHARRVWVPAHGRQPSWDAPTGLSTDLLRLLNDKVDEEARNCMSRRLTGSARQHWSSVLDNNTEWEKAAIMAASSAARQLQLHLETGGREADAEEASARAPS